MTLRMHWLVSITRSTEKEKILEAVWRDDKRILIDHLGVSHEHPVWIVRIDLQLGGLGILR